MFLLLYLTFFFFKKKKFLRSYCLIGFKHLLFVLWNWSFFISALVCFIISLTAFTSWRIGLYLFLVFLEHGWRHFSPWRCVFNWLIQTFFGFDWLDQVFTSSLHHYALLSSTALTSWRHFIFTATLYFGLIHLPTYLDLSVDLASVCSSCWHCLLSDFSGLTCTYSRRLQHLDVPLTRLIID